MRLTLFALPMMLMAAEPVLISPKVGLIEIYGVRRVPVEKIRQALRLVPGDPLPKSKGDLEASLQDVPGIVETRVEALCCENGRAMLYVGIAEKGALTPRFREEPEVEISLPENVLAAYQSFTEALGQAARDQNTSESLIKGYSLMSHPEARAAQEKMLELASANEFRLRQILREAADPDQRAIAAYILQYVPGKKFAVDDLQLALQDPDEGVRLNAMRALKALAVYARTDREAGIRVQPTWFVELLNSLVVGDRLESSKALAVLTETMDDNTLANLKDRALPSLFEMARWQHLEHALPSFLVLGRVAGWKDERTQQAWSGGEREKTLEEWRKALKVR